eukprot:m.217771 g.217771  ORF g.217771 m.217771 type:complete len:347 (-) comp33245_c0_seq3:2171-3211(-)
MSQSMVHAIAFAALQLGLVGSVDVPTVTLNTGQKMPVMLWGSGGDTQENSTSTAPAVTLALKSGFPGLDCANHYHNQKGVAAGIKASGISPSKIWLQTKVEPCGHSIITPVREGHCYNDTLNAFQQNLEQLEVETVDLTLIHSPPCVLNASWSDGKCYWPDQPDAVYPQQCNCVAAEPCAMMQEQWRALELMFRQGKTKAIGVSNFCKACLECLSKTSTVIPAVNQLQFHVGMGGVDSHDSLVAFNTERGTVVQAYSPLGGDDHATILGDNTLKVIGVAHNKSTAQIALKWLLQQGFPLTTSTTKQSYMEEDLGVWGWAVSPHELDTLTALNISNDDPVKSMCLLD